jgi:hypothetical protein
VELGLKTRSMRGDLSAPVLAIIVTIGIIAAGLVLLAWFWWFAPSAGKAGTLQVYGQPSIIYADPTKIIISARNTGNDIIEITSITVKNVTCDFTTKLIALDPGESKVIEISNATANNANNICNNLKDLNIKPTEYTVQGIIYTNYGTYTVNFAVIRP